MKILMFSALALLLGCGPSPTPEQQVKAYKTCIDGGMEIHAYANQWDGSTVINCKPPVAK